MIMRQSVSKETSLRTYSQVYSCFIKHGKRIAYRPRWEINVDTYALHLFGH